MEKNKVKRITETYKQKQLQLIVANKTSNCVQQQFVR